MYLALCTPPCIHSLPARPGMTSLQSIARHYHQECDMCWPDTVPPFVQTGNAAMPGQRRFHATVNSEVTCVRSPSRSNKNAVLTCRRI
jgi:hypothetical protein